VAVAVVVKILAAAVVEQVVEQVAPAVQASLAVQEELLDRQGLMVAGQQVAVVEQVVVADQLFHRVRLPQTHPL
jgi:hypothetical protein